jgi:ribonuclease-3
MDRNRNLLFFMYTLEHLLADLSAVEDKLGYVFENKSLLAIAFTHRSYINEHREASIAHNERLEFLGDSVLGLVMAESLYHRLPTDSEGKLSQLRSKLVDASSCAEAFEKLELPAFLLLGRGERMSEGRSKGSIFADAFEAVVGAIFLDGGLAMAKSFLLCHLDVEVNRVIGSPPRNYKAELQDFCQKRFQTVPNYQVESEKGPEHAKVFHVVVSVEGKVVGEGEGKSKKEAEQSAALDAIERGFVHG